MNDWARDAVFYHVYPLGALGAPERNDFTSPPVARLAELDGWLDHIADLGANAIYLGPVFESTAHGYDTADYYTVDRRLGTNDTLARFAWAVHERGMRLVLDGVFHHVGRDFWAFRDVQEKGWDSPYRDWFFLDFGRRSSHGDAFAYEGWQGHYDLVKLNTGNPGVRAHLFDAVRQWVTSFGIDGLRLDAADSLDLNFQRELARVCRELRPDFWLMGEVIHGDYRRWASNETLDSVTNYELYKALYSSHNDRNYWELGYALNRHSGEHGLYRDLSLYTFADNHDVDRIASQLKNPAHLYPLYALLFTVPGTPSIYYGSEGGITGRKTRGTDAPLRPAMHPAGLREAAPQRDLVPAIQRLAALRRDHVALRRGGYRPVHVGPEQIAFLRETGDERLVVAVNASGEPVSLDIRLPEDTSGQLADVLNGGEPVALAGGRANLQLYPAWARVFRIEPS